MAKNFDTINPIITLTDDDKFIVGQIDEDRKATLAEVVSFVESKDLNLTTTSLITASLTTEDILPDMTGAAGVVSVRNIGSPTQKFDSVYADEVFIGASSLYVNGKKVIEDNSDVMTFETDVDQAVTIKTSSTTDGVGNGNLTIQSGNEINMIGAGGMEFTVSGPVGKSMTFTNTSTGGNIQFHGETVTNGDFIVTGDLTVQGTTTAIDTQTLLIEDNLITINSNQTGTPATSMVGGIEVERGDELSYRFIFEELTDTFKIGEQGSLQSVATREDAPTTDGLAFWDDANNRFDTAAGMTFNGSTLSVNVTGSLTGNASTATKLATPRNIELVGDVTGNVNFDGSGNVDITTVVGNDSHVHTSVGKLTTARTISLSGDATGSVSFDGSSNVSIPVVIGSNNHNHDTQYLGISSNAVSATKLNTVRTISLSGDATGSVSFDGSSNVSIPVVIGSNNHNHNTQYLGITAKASDSNLLDGIDSSQFLRSTAKAADANLLDGHDTSYFATAHSHPYLGSTAKATSASNADAVDGYSADNNAISTATTLATKAAVKTYVDGKTAAVGFKAYKSNHHYGAANIVCDTAAHNYGNYSTSTGVFTAPVSGVYIFNVTGLWFGVTTAGHVSLKKNNVGLPDGMAYVDFPQTVAYPNFSFSTTVVLAAGDTMVPFSDGQNLHHSYTGWSGEILHRT